jgi:nucleotide-binding universal stress UspA family protein
MSTVQLSSTDAPAVEPVTLEVGSYAAEVWSPPLSLVVPTDGSLGADAAVMAARALAERESLSAELLTVFERSPMYDAPLATGMSSLEVDLAAKQGLWQEIEQQRRRLVPRAERWPVTFEEGDPSRVIAGIARDRSDPLIIMGLGHHGMVERMVGRELALDVIREGAAPVYAVHPELPRLPRFAMAALDFSPASIEAARLALYLLGECGTLYLAFARPATAVPLAEPAPWEVPSEQMLRVLFGEVSRSLGAPQGVTIEPVVLHGDPTRALLAFAAEQGIELIAAGTHGYTMVERMLMGSVSTRLLRSADCSVLIAPPHAEKRGNTTN